MGKWNHETNKKWNQRKPDWRRKAVDASRSEERQGVSERPRRRCFRMPKTHRPGVWNRAVGVVSKTRFPRLIRVNRVFCEVESVWNRPSKTSPWWWIMKFPHYGGAQMEVFWRNKTTKHLFSKPNEKHHRGNSDPDFLFSFEDNSICLQNLWRNHKNRVLLTTPTARFHTPGRWVFGIRKHRRPGLPDTPCRSSDRLASTAFRLQYGFLWFHFPFLS